ncbi:hypothetical protein BEH94_02000 [Candidatus Altiarchaeales archaeon WOR_SM1_SCG]|nr:hypothetical protein BEH94_02000 [Candidatus Altiarchaeales archaeon WOR_SM1_SCG]
MNNNCALTLKFPGWLPLEINEFLDIMTDSNDIEIKSNQKSTTKGTDGVSISSSVISILTPSVTISKIIYDWFRDRKENNKPVKYMKANDVMIPVNCERGNINQKIRRTLPHWNVRR